jgi:hypothetical protein
MVLVVPEASKATVTTSEIHPLLHPIKALQMTTPIQYGQYRVPPATEMVNFGVGQPAPGLLPLDRVRASAAAKFSEEDPLFLQVSSPFLTFAYHLALYLFLCKGGGWL